MTALATSPPVPRLHALVADARSVPADARQDFALRVSRAMPAASLVVETCHRVEVYAGDHIGLSELESVPAGARPLAGEQAARHLIELAVGLHSSVVGEDQVLHQLRISAKTSWSHERLDPDLHRLLDVALRAGRRARSLLPAERPSLADLALTRVAHLRPLQGAEVLVVGAGQMGRLAAEAAIRAGASVRVASRTHAHARALASRLGARTAPFRPDPADLGVAGVIVALRGAWDPGQAAEAAVSRSRAWIVDLSFPSAVPDGLRRAAGDRFVSIDALSDGGVLAADAQVVARLRQVADAAYDDYVAWLRRRSASVTVRTMAERAEEAADAELDALWRRLPTLDGAEREEIERMTRHLAERLLREPIERLSHDTDGRHARQARELFGL